MAAARLRWLWRLALLAAILVLVAWGGRRLLDPVSRIPGLADGPPGISALAAPVQASPADYAAGAPSRLAIYLTDPAAPWLALAFGLRTIGVPFVVTADVHEAVRHKLVLAYPTISGQRVNGEASLALRAHVEGGGTLLGFEVLGAGLNDLFGLAEPRAGRGFKTLAWSPEAAHRWGFEHAAEQSIPLAGAGMEAGSAGYALVPQGAEVLARFDNGDPALLHHAQGRGHAYALGLDLGAFIASAQQGRRQGRSYVNGYEPGVDVLLRWLRLLYREAEPLAVTLATVPQGRPLALVLTHDVDFGVSVRNSLDYARSEASQQVRATYFVQTKYVRDWNDAVFFDAAALQSLRALDAAGGEIASHSVSHSPVFSKLPLGTGSERYPAYAPFVASRTETRDASLLGELRVSRYLLEQATPGRPLASFRPGHLQYPFALPEALQATGYRYSSSLTSGTALSHLPYRLSHHGDGRAALPVWEFPVTLEDERLRPMDTALLPVALEVARRLRAYGGVCVLLIHPNVTDDKLRFQQALVARLRGEGAWIGPLGEFAAWWEARDGVQVDVSSAAGGTQLVLRSPVAIKGLALQLPAGWRIAAGAPLPVTTGVHGQWLDLPAGDTTLPLESGAAP